MDQESSPHSSHNLLQQETEHSLSRDVGEASPEARSSARASLDELVARLENDHTPRDEFHFRTPIAQLGRAIHDREEEVPLEVIAEDIAFSMHAHDHQEASSWGLYFGPFMSWTTQAGETIDSPDLARISGGMLSYWRQRAITSTHPVMRARYADLLWELPKKLPEGKPDPTMARLAIDSYLEAVEGERFEHAITAIGKAKRALSIAASLGDAPRITRARDVLVALEDKVSQDDSPGLWGFAFDTLIEPPNKRIPIPDGLREKLVSDLEARLGRLVTPSDSDYHPHGAELAALRLASYYRRRSSPADVERVLRAYGAAVMRMCGVASPLILADSLERLYDQFNSFGLRDDADALNEPIRVAGEESLKDMKVISTKVEIPTEQVESFFEGMFTGTAEEVLTRAAIQFIPNRGRLERQLRHLATQAPLSYVLNRTLKDDEGRTIAHIGPLESDLEGQLVSHIGQELHLRMPLLRETIARGVEKGLITVPAVLDFILACPLFPSKRRPVLECGLTAYLRNESIAAIHVLVPQIEQGIRQLAILLRAPIYRQRPGGGLHVRALDDLLRDESIGDVLGGDVVAYLRVLLTDARGWNLRNSVCHGLASTAVLNMPAADRVVHSLLVLSLVRQQEVASDSSDPTDTAQGAEPQAPSDRAASEGEASREVEQKV